jgi:hypothetical protein
MSRGEVDAMRDDYEMRDKDAAEFGAIVDRLVGLHCERTLATNTIKLHFNTEGPRGGQYIWIDPPWVLYEGDREVTTSTDYDDSHFLAWSELFQPLNSTLLEAWHEDDSGGSVFVFSHGYRLFVPHVLEPGFEYSWYVHWYATESASA